MNLVQLLMIRVQCLPWHTSNRREETMKRFKKILSMLTQVSPDFIYTAFLLSNDSNLI